MSGPNFASGTVWTGDNLPVMRGMNSECVDLIYLDPPFNSNRYYEAPIGSQAAGAAFKDAWTLDDVDVYEHGELAERNPAAYSIIETARQVHGKGMQSYLIMMAVRLLEMHRILKETGSIYLHCDFTAGHYLKLLMDSVFGRENFKNEIVWYYYNKMHDYRKRQFASASDMILFYVKNQESSFVFHHVREEREKPTRQLVRKKVDGKLVNAKDADGNLLYQTKTDRGIDNVWRIPYVVPASSDYTGFRTQKPVPLLIRLLESSTDKGDMVFDPFCGCATALVAADRLQRRWIGIDLSPKAVELVNERIAKDRGVLPWGGAIALIDPPMRTDLGTLPNYRTHRHRLYGEQEGICKGCNIHFPFSGMAVDHILPTSKGGTDHSDNLQLLCTGCNSSKGNKTMAQWRATQ
ncbi:MAG: DNA methyltransferase [Rhodospirillaceae bacterium]|nr:DNA methyltransferase [Rhodospirillaceae bacterium]